MEYQGLDAENNLLVKFQDKILKYKLLHNLEFTSDRKRQSVILEAPNKQILLMCKGADSILLNLINKKQSGNVSAYLQALQLFSTQGLRTLLMAQRVLPPEEYKEWSLKYSKACASIDKREQLMSAAQSQIEKNLVLVGVTGIEDKLQDQVPEAILSFRQAGIKVWVLTGDKVETAINVAFACKLITD